MKESEGSVKREDPEINCENETADQQWRRLAAFGPYEDVFDPDRAEQP